MKQFADIIPELNRFTLRFKDSEIEEKYKDNYQKIFFKSNQQ